MRFNKDYHIMLFHIKLFLQNLIPIKIRSKIKKSKRRLTNNLLKRNAQKTSISYFRIFLTSDFGIKKKDNIIISSSFGNLNSTFSPKELIILLQELVGEEGNLTMPFYPPTNSYEWAESGQIFDMRNTPSSVGILTQIFSEMPNVYKSKHPTKAVVAWGKNAQEIVAEHENSTTPFYWDSPYGWLLKNPSKSMGLGVLNRPIIHACEDILFGTKKYYKKMFELSLRDYDNSIIKTKIHIHDPFDRISINKMTQLINSLNLQTYIKMKTGFSYSYIFDNQELLKRYVDKFSNNKSN